MAGVSDEIIHAENNNASVNSSNSADEEKLLQFIHARITFLSSLKKVSANTSVNSTFQNNKYVWDKRESSQKDI